MFPELVTAHVAVPPPIRTNARPISTWNGTTHTDIIYDDDDDYDYDGCTDYDYAYGDSFNMNDPSVQLQFQKCLRAAHHIDTTTKHTQAVSQHADPPPSKHTMTKHTQEEPTPYIYDTLHLLFLTTHYENTNEYIDAFPLYTVPQYITRKKHPSHDNYLYHSKKFQVQLRNEKYLVQNV